VFGVSGFEFVILAVLALLVFGPDRLPSIAADAGRMIRQLRKMAQEAREEVSGAFPELDDLGLADLDPRQFVRRQLLEEKDDLDAALDGRPTSPAKQARPVESAVAPTDVPAPADSAPTAAVDSTMTAPGDSTMTAPVAADSAVPTRSPWDADAT
jgi:sec-independent protein translocase protein TatB